MTAAVSTSVSERSRVQLRQDATERAHDYALAGSEIVVLEGSKARTEAMRCGWELRQ